MEWLRRVALVVGLLGTLWAVLVPASALVEVRVADFAARQARRPRWEGAADLSADAFIVRETEGRTIEGKGPVLEALATDALAVANGRPVVGSRADRVGRRSYSGPALLLAASDPAAAALAPPLCDDRPFAYLRVAGPGAPIWLEALFVRPGREHGIDPSRLAYPARPVAGWWALAGLAGYAALPRPRRGPTTAYHHRGRAVVLPDLLGVVLTGMFFALPLFVIPSTASTGDLFDPGWVVLLAIGWGLAGFGLAIFAAAAWYAALLYDVLDDRLVRRTLFGRSEVPFSEIAQVREVEVRAPKALVRASLLLGLIDPRLLGQGLLLAGRSDAALEVVAKDGRSFRVLTGALENEGPLLRALEGAAGRPLRAARPGARGG